MMAGLDHPNIVRILGATQTGAHFNMFVEWMPGGSLSHLLEVYGAFSEPVMCSYTQQILSGLAYLHDNGILHRDMKGLRHLHQKTYSKKLIVYYWSRNSINSRATATAILVTCSYKFYKPNYNLVVIVKSSLNLIRLI